MESARSLSRPGRRYGEGMSHPVGRLRRELIMAAVAIVVLGLMLVAINRLGWRPQLIWGYFWSGVTAIAVIVGGRRLPLPVLCVVGALLAVGSVVAGDDVGIAPPLFLIAPLCLAAFFAISLSARPTLSIAVFSIASIFTVVPFFSLATVLWGPNRTGTVGERLGLFDWSSITLLLAGSVLTSILGLSVRRQRIVVDLLRKRTSELEELRSFETQRVVEHTRSMLAREIHDEVAHHVAALVITSNAGLRLSDEHPERLPAIMRDLSLGGKEALGALRRIVRVLQVRTGEVDPARQAALGTGLREIAERVGRAGLLVEYEILGDESLTGQQCTAVLLIAQEALTNVLLHSSSRRARLELTIDSGLVKLTIADEGPASERFPDLPLGGTGLASMGDRTRALGGSIMAGPSEPEGWTVRAEFPRVARSAL